jgi:hypothetical protein
MPFCSRLELGSEGRLTISASANVTMVESRSYANSTMSMRKFFKRARPLLDDFYPNHCAEAARADKAFKHALLLAGMALRADYDGASYLRYFHPDQEIEVKTIFVRFFDPPDAGTEEAAWAGSSRFSEAQSFYDDLPGYTECDEDADLSGYLVQDRPELVGRTGCIMTFCPNGFTGLPDLDAVSCASLDTTTSYAMDNLAATVLHEYLHWDRLTTGGIANMGGPPLIQDWNDPPVLGADPTSGYGPYNSMRINQLYAQPGRAANGPDRPNPYYNAENYVWFALEEYFKWKCPEHAGGFGDPLPISAPPNEPLPDHRNPVLAS